MDPTLSQAPEEPIIPTEEVAAETPDEGSPQAQPQQEKPLTRDDVIALMREFNTREIMPTIQSHVDKGDNRVRQAIEQRLAALQDVKGTLSLSDEQFKQAQRQIIEEETVNAYARQDPQAQSGKANEQSPEAVDPGQMIASLNAQAFQIGGSEVTPNDAEWKKIEAAFNDPNGSPYAYLIAATDASREKAARLAQQKAKAPARVTGAGGVATSTEGYDPNKPASYYLEQAARKEKR